METSTASGREGFWVVENNGVYANTADTSYVDFYNISR